MIRGLVDERRVRIAVADASEPKISQQARLRNGSKCACDDFQHGGALCTSHDLIRAGLSMRCKIPFGVEIKLACPEWHFGVQPFTKYFGYVV